jgi:quercetin dioxygenase-like cupin family protein
VKVTPGVVRTSLLAGASAEALRADRFHYPPGGHTHWHLHTGEQVLYGESGAGWVRFADQDRVAIEPGAVVHVPVGLRHWHGARPDTALVHIAIDAALTLVTDDVVYDNVPIGAVTGPDGIRSALSRLLGADRVADPLPSRVRRRRHE